MSYLMFKSGIFDTEIVKVNFITLSFLRMKLFYKRVSEPLGSESVWDEKKCDTEFMLQGTFTTRNNREEGTETFIEL
jgi:hypothetical protein